MALVLVVAPALQAAAGAEPPVAWLGGTALERQLRTPVDVFWSGTPLRQAVVSLAYSRRAAVLIDRRVDPGQKLDLQWNGLPLEQVYREVAQTRQLGVAWLGPVAYFGPPQATSRLRTLAELRREEVRRLPAAAGRKLLASGRIGWDDFATPRDLLARAAAESGIEISGLEQVPHDLWAGADLPALSLVDRVTLIAGQFDLTFEIAADGSAVALVPVPDDVAIVRSYPGGREPQALADRWAALVPESRVEIVAGEIFVRGPLEDHERIAGSARPPRQTRPAANRSGQASNGEKRFTVPEGKGQLGPVLEQLAGRLGLTLKIDREALQRAGISLQQPISFSVDNATLEELFEAVLAPAGCTFRLQDDVLEIRPAR
ncbi:MAG TPA: hypothetical protein VMY37_10880 [Thermoguttaceae bacterium]|nr:hypothetical protein [Thermoguttaceae bacterium]